MTSRATRAALWIVPLTFLAVFFVYPVAVIVIRGLTPGGDLDLSPLREVITDPAGLEPVQEGLKKKGFKIESAEVSMNASQVVSLNENTAPGVLKLLDQLEEHDDVQSVYSNIDVPADVMERISERV
jgi:hypothetical protein